MGGRGGQTAALLTGLVVLILIGYGLGEIGRHATNAVDLDAVRALIRQRTGALTLAAHALSVLGRSVVIIPLALVTAAWLRGSGRAGDAVLLIVSVIGALVLYNVDKALVERPRPPVHHLESASNWSFPSGHAALSGAFYVALAMLSATCRRRRALAISAAALLIGGIAVSRVYLAVHYPSDVVSGMLLGLAWCLFADRVLRPPGSADVDRRPFVFGRVG
jgi:membrane-associated phospholipid phosphatase